MKFSLWIYSLFPFAMLLSIIFKLDNPYIINSLMIILSIGAAFVINKMYIWCLDLIDLQNQGKASALIIVLRLAVTSLVVQICSHFYNGKFASMAFFLMLSSGFGVLIMFLISKKESKFKDFIIS
jgi:hypothetical protein